MLSNATPIIFGVAFAILSVVLVRNEVFFDDWYIEAAADGLFGDDNRAFLTVGSNYIISMLIWLLSQSGIRLSWLQVLMVGMNTISSMIVCKVICGTIEGKRKYVFAGVMLATIMPFVSFYLQFTTTAAYAVATGTLWIFYAQFMKKTIKSYILGGGWVVLGAALRFDVVYFTIFFMGSIAVIKIIQMVWHGRKNIRLALKEIICFIAPFVIVLFSVCIIEVSQRYCFNKYYPGFREWNEIRAHVDDYELPDYWSNEDEYRQIGVSYNDYKLLKSWNNLDENFFDKNLYKKILDIKNKHNAQNISENGIFNIVNIIKIVQSNYCFWILISIIGIAYGLGRANGIIGMIVTLVNTYLLSAYFILSRRFIWRTEWPIYMVALITMLVSYFCFSDRSNNKERQIHRKYVWWSVWGILLMTINLQPDVSERNEWSMYNGKSLLEIYKERSVSDDSYGKYVWDKLHHNDVEEMATIDRDLNAYTSSNKQLLFYHLFSTDWLQPNPLTNKDLFRTEDVGGGENWSCLGQYIYKLHPIMQINQNYGIHDVFRELTNDNVRVIAQNNEMRNKSEELNIYLKEHYYTQVDFSLTAVLPRYGIGQYITSIEDVNYVVCDTQIRLSAPKITQYTGMVRIDIEGIDEEKEKCFVQLFTTDGELHNFNVITNGKEKFFVIYDDALDVSKTYMVRVINGEKVYNMKGTYNISEVLSQSSFAR